MTSACALDDFLDEDSGIIALIFVQAVANTGVAVLGLANVAIGELGKLHGIITISTAVGTSVSLLIAGALLKLVGYWSAWAVAFIASFVGIILQSLMLEPAHKLTLAGKRIIRTHEEFGEESPLFPAGEA